MIGKSDWFKLRKYGGWGINPNTWQGYSYAIIIAIIIAIPQFINSISLENRFLLSGLFMLLILFDVLDIMRNMKLDEREEAHQAKAERNASLSMVFTITLILIYVIFVSIITSKINYELISVLFAILFIGFIAKTLTYYKLEK